MQSIKLNSKQMEELFNKLRQKLSDPRCQKGRRHFYFSTLTIGMAATLAGQQSYAAIADWAKNLSQRQLKRIRARFNHKTQKFEVPSESTIRRILMLTDGQALDDCIGEWILGITDQEEAIAIDGKVLRGAKREDGSQVQLMSAILQQTGATLAQRQIGKKTNEIPELKNLLKDIDIKGRVVTTDALNTQVGSANFIVEKKSRFFANSQRKPKNLVL